MGYDVIDPDDLDPLPDRDAEARSISGAAGFETLGVRRYRAAPGQQIPLRYHYHDEQEEAFYVVSGELHVETPEREYVVGTGQFFAVRPGSAHRAHNPATAGSDVVVVAMGAPSVSDAHGYEPE